MINILIIDDEEDIREILSDIININFNDIRIVGFGKDVKSGIIAIEKHKPDIILLDINLPDGTGFDLLSKIETESYNFNVIFITAFEEYAIKAFKFCAIDYLLKPIDTEELLNAIKKCRILLKDELKNKVEAYSYNTKGQFSNKKLILKTQNNIQIVNLQDIIRCQSDNSYTTFYTTDNRTIIVSQSLKEYEELLQDYNFFRIHQSHLINIAFVLSYEKIGGGVVLMQDQSSIPVSFRKKEAFLKILKTKYMN